MPEREDDHEALAAGPDIDMGRRIKLRRIQLGLKVKAISPGRSVPSPSDKCRNTRTAPTAMSASRLYLIAEALGVGVGFFYGLDDAAAGIDTAAVAGSIGLLGRAVRDRGPRMLPRHDARTAQHLR
jgi:hypothetical protein